ncbi:retrovirus-related Pol polyprotein from type-2 retrotransposable element R2DM [Elysia marginata]|uniref:Retrovirus-related Pol polyprotein from type-2 retrotransposable element R2DM n=1 Tax=Elysia marginata TaxID=1093978 RepID=A0AAV4FRR8_9GAST|nr:retrovirus-related Pol polyprotein from type-2 retrotransposable element R2DM [Elysia marginata]
MALHHLCCQIWKQQEWPEDWKLQQFLMLYKNSSSKECGNYRTIALISHASKILLIIILNRMKCKVEEELSDCQTGYRANRGTTDMLFVLQIIIEKIRDGNEEGYITFIDYSQAFDSVIHSKLLDIMTEMGFPQHLISMIDSLYHNQKATIRWNNASCEPFNIEKGVRQGCILSPHLFNLYTEQIMKQADIDDMGINIGGRDITNLRYADDTALLSENLTSMKKILHRVNNAGQQAGLLLNAKKTKVMHKPASKEYRAEESTEADARAALKKDVEYYLTEANTYYESLAQYGLRLQIRIAAIEILNVDLVSGPDITQGDVVEAKVLLDNFGKFLKTPARSGDNYDFAVLFTGYDLSGPVVGYAQVGPICENYARGIVELHGAFDTAGIFAHEVGHIFGAEHDPDDSLYIMAPQAPNKLNDKIYQFSNLTADFILKNLRLPYRNFDCLRNTQASSSVPSMTPTKYDGKMQDINALCRRVVGPGSTPCTSSHYYNKKNSFAGDDMCFHVACRLVDNPNGACDTSVLTPEGMPCGRNKVNLLVCFGRQVFFIVVMIVMTDTKQTMGWILKKSRKKLLNVNVFWAPKFT